MKEADIRPVVTMTLQPPGAPAAALGFRLPTISGIPDPYSALAGGLRIAHESPAFAQLPRLEAQTSVAALSEAFVRARYHKLRFDACVEETRIRRRVLGGPVVADWHSVPPIIYEASAFLGAARTVLDTLIYIAARRAGKSESAADRWEASEAICPKVEPGSTSPTRFDAPEILALRTRRRWFERLNLYRNVVYHRGLGSKHYGYHAKSDTAEEARDPDFNAMLLPDEASLSQRKRLHEWTYKDKSRLDDLVAELDDGLSALLLELLTELWGCPVPQEGTVPRDAQPNCFLYLPMTVVFREGTRSVVPVFDSKFAARAFQDIPAAQRANLTIRAVRPTKIGDQPPAFLLPVLLDDSPTSWLVSVYSMENGKLRVTGSVEVDPRTTPIPGIIPLGFLRNTISALYVWQPKKRARTS
jgi:hypothetical protein